eukprot:2018071-Prymnesium_polylepis.1
MKLILSLDPRKFRPFFTLSAIYVLASRVKLGCQIRIIGFNPQCDDPTHLTSLQHPAVLGIWESGYAGEAGYEGEQWCVERCSSA